MNLQYLLDEHVWGALADAIIREEPLINVWSIGDPGAPPLGTLDPDILIWCEEHDFVLVTNNRKSMPRHLADHLAQGRHVPGIFVLSDQQILMQAARELVMISIASFENEHRDVIKFLPLTS